MRIQILVALVLVAGVHAAQAQTAAPAAPPEAQPAPAKPRPAKAAPSVILINNSSHKATEVVVSAGDVTAKLSKPLAPKGKATLRLPKLKGCEVVVTATFEGEGQVNAGEFDICKDKTVRFTD
jgi:hypothetical protein